VQVEEGPVWTQHAPQSWYVRIDGHLLSLGLSESVVDPKLYYNNVNGVAKN
jgi:hypothetical protein